MLRLLSLISILKQVHYNVAKVRGEKGQVEVAEAFYREAIRYS